MERAVLIPVRIGAGRADGVKPNMLFRLVGEPDYSQYLQVTRVGRKTASGYVVRDVSSDWQETYRDHETDQDRPLPPDRVGAKVTTGRRLD